MKVSADISQIRSDYGGGFFNIINGRGLGIAINGIPNDCYLLAEKDLYGGFILVATDNINDWISANENYERYKLVGNMKEIVNKLNAR